MSYTPGPWKVIHDEEEGTFEIGMKTYLDDDAAYDSAHHIDLYDCTWPEDGEQFKEIEANARLIAAAPEMYEALKEAVAFIESLEYFGVMPKEVTKPDLDGFKGAIAKAEGREVGK